MHIAIEFAMQFDNLLAGRQDHVASGAAETIVHTLTHTHPHASPHIAAWES